MDLFRPDAAANLLPYDGVASYHGSVLGNCEAWDYFEALRVTVPWKNDEVVIFGKHHLTAREVAWYGDSDFPYTYSGATKRALPWTRELATLKCLVEKLTGAIYNSCLLNLYHDGKEGMGWHSDDEKTLVKDASIASISLGAERKFAFKHKRTKETVSLILEHGSLLEMKGRTQTFWLHRLPPSTRVAEPRINLTFRTMNDRP